MPSNLGDCSAWNAQPDSGVPVVTFDRLLATEPAAGRHCAGCSVCCVLPVLVELAKPARTPCPNLEGCLCRIYTERPESCRAFNCLWLRGVLDAALENRPDQSGVLLDAYIRQPGNETRIIATEAWSGAADAPLTRQTLESLATFATVVVYYRDGRQSTITASEQGVAGEPPIEG
jgi:hypothetical protein